MSDKQSITPEYLKDYYSGWHMSPGLECGGFIFLTGVTGYDENGSISADPETQFRAAFDKVALILNHAGLEFEAVVEMTTYHINLHDNLALFRTIRDEYVQEPWPAWTAIEVTGFVTKGALVEIRAVAHRGAVTP